MLRKPLLLVILVVQLTSTRAVAGCLADGYLSSISEVSVVARVPQYEPLPGRDPEHLETEIRDFVSDILGHHGYAISGVMGVSINVRIRYILISEDALVLMVQIQVEEPAKIVRNTALGDSQEVRVITWERAELVRTSISDTDKVLLETVETLVVDFHEAVQEAKAGAHIDAGHSAVPESKEPARQPTSTTASAS